MTNVNAMVREKSAPRMQMEVIPICDNVSPFNFTMSPTSNSFSNVNVTNTAQLPNRSV